jgi:hypothetical protein
MAMNGKSFLVLALCFAVFLGGFAAGQFHRGFSGGPAAAILVSPDIALMEAAEQSNTRGSSVPPLGPAPNTGLEREAFLPAVLPSAASIGKLNAQIPPAMGGKCDGCLGSPEDFPHIQISALKTDLEILKNPQNYDSEAIVRAINRMSGYLSPDGYAAMECLISDHESPDVRAAAVESLSEPEYLGILTLASRDRDVQVREAAISNMTVLDRELRFGEDVRSVLEREQEADVLDSALDYFYQNTKNLEQFIGLTSEVVKRDDLSPEILIRYAKLLSDYSASSDYFDILLSSPSLYTMEPDSAAEVEEEIARMRGHGA